MERVSGGNENREVKVDSRLARARYFDEALTVRLAGTAGLRNLIVHRYGQLDCSRIAAIVRDELGGLETFVASMQGSG